MAKNRGGTLDWRGDEVFDRMLDATKIAIDETTAECVKDAKENVPVVTATLQGSLRIEPAMVKRGEVSGLWGSFDVNYALAVETGNRSLVGPSGSSTRERGGAGGRGKNTGNRNFLRNAADKHYPRLIGRIRRRLKR